MTSKATHFSREKQDGIDLALKIYKDKQPCNSKSAEYGP